jgi:nucleoside-diphosphate-sugar epimerase
MLVEHGHEVINLTRGNRQAYVSHAAWESVRQIVVDRRAEDAAGTFGQCVRDLEPDVVIDLICFTLASARQLVEALRGQVQQFLHCGTIWVHGHATTVPTTEDQPRQPFGEYGIEKAAIEAYLLKEARINRFPATVLHPGHIVGVGWAPLNPAGHFNPQVFAKLARGEALALPNFGLETVHHVHAADVAQSFIKAMTYWSNSVGESFHVVSPAAVTLRGYAEAVARWFAKEAKLEFLPWEQWKESLPAEEVRQTWEHIARSPSASIAKAQRLIDYRPRCTSLQAVEESVRALIKAGTLII